mmetsp:Transcript_101256/g.286954  ORF Transcript_101256/g.286954 Transcript_101256/m.286954 type:complete len:285 (+) Transcript_101256:440-1294(+)
MSRHVAQAEGAAWQGSPLSRSTLPELWHCRCLGRLFCPGRAQGPQLGDRKSSIQWDPVPGSLALCRLVAAPRSHAHAQCLTALARSRCPRRTLARQQARWLLPVPSGLRLRPLGPGGSGETPARQLRHVWAQLLQSPKAPVPQPGDCCYCCCCCRSCSRVKRPTRRPPPRALQRQGALARAGRDPPSVAPLGPGAGKATPRRRTAEGLVALGVQPGHGWHGLQPASGVAGPRMLPEGPGGVWCRRATGHRPPAGRRRGERRAPEARPGPAVWLAETGGARAGRR